MNITPIREIHKTSPANASKTYLLARSPPLPSTPLPSLGLCAMLSHVSAIACTPIHDDNGVRPSYCLLRHSWRELVRERKAPFMQA